MRLVKLLAEDASESRDLGYIWWSTAVGIQSDQLVGENHDEEFMRLISETEVELFRMRNLGLPLYDWVPLLRFSKMGINAGVSAIRSVASLFGCTGPSLLFDADHAKSVELRQKQSYYCKRQLADLNKRIAEGDETPSQLGDIFRSLPEPLPEAEQYRVLATVTGAAMAQGTLLT